MGMTKLSGVQEVRLYESLGTIGVALDRAGIDPINLLVACRRPAWNLPETDESRALRARLRRALSDLVDHDWDWVFRVMGDPGTAQVLRRWAIDAGHIYEYST